jgi:fibronectin-binding autotransporter adhesin
MRLASSRVVLWVGVLLILVAPFTFAQTSSVSKNRLSKRALTGQPAPGAAAAPRAALKRQAPPPVITDTWTGGGGSDTNWSDASNWNSGAPTTGDSVVINTTTAATVDDFNISIANLTLSNAGDSVTTTGANLTVNGSITNNGSINLVANTFGAQGILTIAGNSTLTGTGVLLLGNDTTQNFIGGASGVTLTNASTIEGGTAMSGGYAAVGQGQITLANSGTINANVSGGTLYINPISSGASTNTGTLEATGGGILLFSGGTWSQSGAGTMTAANGSTIDLQNNVSITGGTLTTSGSGVFQQNNGGTVSLANITNNGTYNITLPGGVTDISGTITNNGTINLLANTFGAQGILNLTANATLAGTGAVVIGNETTQNFIGGASGTTLTNASTIEGGTTQTGQYDAVGNGQITLANTGTINANVSGGVLYANPISSGASTNTGTLEATNSGTLVLSGGTWTQSGTGTISAANGSTIDLQNNVSITGGTLTTSGSGVIQQNNGGTVSLANITNNGTYNITLPGGVTDISGTITNNGTINLLANTFGAQGILNLTANTTLTGTGAVVIGNETTQNFIDGASGTTLTNDSTIQGGTTSSGGFAGIGSGHITLANNGTINANVNGGLLYVNPISSGASTNTKTLEATNGGTLILSGGTWTQTGAGTITAAAGSTVALQSGVSITGGTLTTAGTGLIAQNSGGTVSLSNLTNAGTYQIQTVGGQTNISGTITNNGTISLLGSSGQGILNLTANTTLTGTGSLVLGNTPDQNFIAGTSGTTLTNASTIEGGANLGGGSFAGIGNGQITLANNGTINANLSGGLLYVNPLSTAANTNTKTMEATNGGTLVLDGSSWTQTGGTITAATGSTVQLTSGVSITGGTLTTSGSGIIEETNGQTVSLNSLTNSGTYNVLDSSTTKISGTITNTGTINLNSTGSPTSLFLTANTTLAGKGVVVMGGAGNNIIDGVSSAVLTNASTIEGQGNLGNNHITITNNGTFDSNITGDTLAILPGSGGFTNYNGTATTLTGGTYIANGGNITFAAGNTTGITTLAASVTEENGGQILNTSNSNANALAGLTSITSAGALTIGGVAFVDAGSFSNAGSLTILSGESFKVGSLTQISGSSLTAGTFVLDANLNLTGATQTITTNAANLTLGGGTIENANSTNAFAGLATNTGKLTIAGTSNNVSTTAASFSNTGTLTINSGDSFTAAALTQLTGSNSSKTLSAGTYVLAGNLDLTTAGLTITKNSATLTLEGGTINSNGVNALSALASNTGKLTIAGSNKTFTTSAASFSNTGTLTINTGDTFTAPALTQISGSTLSGGTFVLAGNLDLTASANITTNSSVLTLEGGTIKTGSTNDLANLSSNTDSLTLASNASFTAVGNFTNSGALTINKGSTFTLTGSNTLTNLSAGTLASGTYTIGGTLQLTTANGGITTNAANLTLTGTAAKINDGTSNALAGFNNNTGTFALASSVNFTTGGNFTDSGTMTIAQGTKLTIGGTSNTYTQTAGTTNLDGTLAGGSVTVTGGVFQGAGTVSKNLTVGGGGTTPTLNVGDAGKAGLLSITGTYTQLSTGKMNVSIGGTTVGTKYSQLKVTGTASLGGTLTAGLINGFTPTVGQTFTVLTASSVSGTFSNSTISINSTEHFAVSYTSTSVVLTVVSGAAPISGNTAQPATQLAAADPKKSLSESTLVNARNTLRHAATGIAKRVEVTGIGHGTVRVAAALPANTPRIWEHVPVTASWDHVQAAPIGRAPLAVNPGGARSDLTHLVNNWAGTSHAVSVVPVIGRISVDPHRIPIRLLPTRVPVVR